MRGIQGVAAGGLMTLAMAAVGDLVSPRERGRYQGYITAAFAGATVLGPLVGGLLVDHASWRWVFYVNLPVGAAALVALGATLPAGGAGPAAAAARRAGRDAAGRGHERADADLPVGREPLRLDVGADRRRWCVATLALAGALVLRERRAEDPIVPLGMLTSPPVAVASAALFLATASLFAVTVFVPLFLQAVTGATPTQAGLLLVPMMAGTTLSTILAGRAMSRTGRYKRFPLLGLGLMTAAWSLLGRLRAAALRRARRSARWPCSGWASAWSPRS